MLEDRSGGVCLLILCGLPGSGKTRCAKSLLDQCNQPAHETNESEGKNLHFVHIEYDELLPPEIERDILTASGRDDELLPPEIERDILTASGRDDELLPPEIERDILTASGRDDKLLPPEIERDILTASGRDEQEESAWKSYRNDILTCVETLVKNTIEASNGSRLSHMLDGVSKPNSVMQDVWERFSILVCRQTGAVAREDIVCFIIDDNMYYRSMRYKYYQLARKYTVGFCQCCLAVPVDTAIARNSGRQATVDDSIIRTMEGRLELPDDEINSWEKLSVVLKETPDCLDGLINLVREASDNPVLMPEEVDWESRDRSREVCSSSFHHQADQIMRRLISKEMNSTKEKGDNDVHLKELAHKLQQKRKKLLSDLKTGTHLVPSNLNSVKDDSKDSESSLFEFIEELFYEAKVT